MDKNYNAINIFSKYLFLTSSKMQPCLLKESLKTQKKLKELAAMY